MFMFLTGMNIQKIKDWFYSHKSYVTEVGAHEEALFFAKKIYETLRGN